MDTQTTQKRAIEDLAEPICRAHGVELVDVQLKGGRGGAVVRVIIDRDRPDGGDVPGSGVTIDDCTSVSRDLSSALDVHGELVPGSYNLEVSSPGVERPLVKHRDYERFAGREVRVQTRLRIGERKKFQGRLLEVADDHIQIDQDGTPVRIPFESISRANLVYRF
ncbi:MAG: ribosome maturation factor RimP [Myxococcota bacterium]